MSHEESVFPFEISPERKISDLDHSLTHAGRALGELEMAASNIPVGSADSPALDSLVIKMTELMDVFTGTIYDCEEPLKVVMNDASIASDVKQRFQNALTELNERGKKVWDKLPEGKMFI